MARRTSHCSQAGSRGGQTTRPWICYRPVEKTWCALGAIACKPHLFYVPPARLLLTQHKCHCASCVRCAAFIHGRRGTRAGRHRQLHRVFWQRAHRPPLPLGQAGRATKLCQVAPLLLFANQLNLVGNMARRWGAQLLRAASAAPAWLRNSTTSANAHHGIRRFMAPATALQRRAAPILRGRAAGARAASAQPSAHAKDEEAARKFLVDDLGHRAALADAVIASLKAPGSGIPAGMLEKMLRSLAGQWEIGVDAGLNSLINAVRRPAHRPSSQCRAPPSAPAAAPLASAPRAERASHGRWSSSSQSARGSASCASPCACRTPAPPSPAPASTA